MPPYRAKRVVDMRSVGSIDQCEFTEGIQMYTPPRRLRYVLVEAYKCLSKHFLARMPSWSVSRSLRSTRVVGDP